MTPSKPKYKKQQQKKYFCTKIEANFNYFDRI